ncbi:hypothetical protein [Streptomyces sp. NPDC002520]
MLRTARTAPGTSSARRPFVALLAAVVLALLAALSTAAPPPSATGGRTAADAAITEHHQETITSRHQDSGPLAEDVCDTSGTIRTATRQKPHGEPVPPRGHAVTCAPGTPVTPPRPARHTPPTGHTVSTDRHTSSLQGRAPPAFSGT